MFDKIKQWFNGLKEKFIRKRRKIHKADKRELYARILAVFMIFWTVASVFGFIGFARSCEKDRKVTAGAYDGGVVFNYPQSYIVIPKFTVFSLVDGEVPLVQGLEPVNTRFNLRFTFLDEQSATKRFDVDLVGCNLSYPVQSEFVPDYMNMFYYLPLEQSTTRGVSVQRDVYLPIPFNVEKPDLFRLSSLFLIVYDFSSYSGDDLVYSISLFQTSSLNLPISYLTDFDTEESYSNGYDRGYKDGEAYGQNIGYNQGVADANDYTFNSLLSSVIDAPIKAFTSLFNFEILGVNLASFFFSLLTICIVFLILKFVF